MNDHDIHVSGAKIRVIGVGGGGTNAVSTMIKESLEGVDFVCVNTDIQSLDASPSTTKIQIGKELTKGLGAGSNPTVGRDAALEDRQEIQEALSGSDMVFITAGMGGGTGTGGASVVAQIAKDLGALTVGVITKPFLFEGKRRRRQAEEGIAALKEHVDTLLVIPNERLLEVATPELSLVDAFKLADEVLVNAVRGISDIISIPGTINVDFADVKSVMACTGQALMGIGSAQGKNRAIEAANQAISSPLLDDIDIEGASGVLINITAGSNVSLVEVNEACSIIQEAAHEDANIIFGTVIDNSLDEEIRVTVIATGFSKDESKLARHSSTDARDFSSPNLKISGGSKILVEQGLNQATPEQPIENSLLDPSTLTPNQEQKPTFQKTEEPVNDSSAKKSTEKPDSTVLDESTLDIDKSIDDALGLIDYSEKSDVANEDLEIPAYLRSINQKHLS